MGDRIGAIQILYREINNSGHISIMHLLEKLDCSPQDRLSALFLVPEQKSLGFARLGHEILVPTILKDDIKN